MINSFAAGSVWWWRYDFKKGEGRRKKYVVLLCDPLSEDEGCVWAFTTSRGANRYPEEIVTQCAWPKYACYRIEAGQEPWWAEKTWVQFDNIVKESAKGLVQEMRDDQAGFIGPLNEQRLREIWNCAKKSDDVALWAIRLIERTHKARSPSKTRPASTTAPAPIVAVATVSAELVSVRVRFEKHCATCRVQILSLVGLAVEPFTMVVSGTQPPPDGFVVNVEAGFELVSPGCTCTKV
jgi:hypothetical protein